MIFIETLEFTIISIIQETNDHINYEIFDLLDIVSDDQCSLLLAQEFKHPENAGSSSLFHVANDSPLPMIPAKCALRVLTSAYVWLRTANRSMIPGNEHSVWAVAVYEAEQLLLYFKDPKSKSLVLYPQNYFDQTTRKRPLLTQTEVVRIILLGS